MTFAPRHYQLQAHAAVRETWAEEPGAMIVLATGTGKTLTALSLAIGDFVSTGQRVVWIAGREELLDQPARNVAKFWPDVSTGIVQADRHTPDAQIVFASVATLAISPQRADDIVSHGRPALLVVDEAHHAASDSWQAAIGAIGAPLRLGLTATPHREDGADLGESWTIAYSYGIAEAIRDGALVRPYAVVSRVPDLNLEAVGGAWDYDAGDLGAELLRAGVVDHTVEAMRETHRFRALPAEDGAPPIESTAKGRGVLVFTATVEQATLTAEALRADGWRAAVVSGTTPKRDRRRLLRAFERGDVDVLCNAAVLTEGTDLPRASVVVLARPTRSWSLYVQMVGRGMRLHPDKTECLILDLAGATEDHSLVSAPVLIGGSACPKSPNQEHDFAPDEKGRAVCGHCGKRLACFALLGAHEWDATHCCTGCGKPKCGGSPTGGHAWLGAEDFKRVCLYCGVEIRDPMAAMVGPRKRRDDAVEGDWVKLEKVRPDCAAVDVGEFGILYVTWTDGDDHSFRPVFLKRKARKPRPMTDGPIAKAYVRAYADDLVTRAARVAAVDAGWKRAPRPTADAMAYGTRYGVTWRGETAGDFARRVFRVRARERAVKCGIVEETA